MNQEQQQMPLAVEKWWHRLLRVLGYGLTILILVSALIINIENAKFYTYTYSFEPNFDESTGDKFDCHAYETLERISCGEYEDGPEFIKFYLSVIGDRKLKDGSRTINELFTDLRAKKSDSVIAVEVIQNKKYSYRRQQHWDVGKLLFAIVASFGIAVGFFMALFGLYKVVLFVVHGHTRIVKG